MNISSVIKLVISILFTAIFSQVCPAQELMEIKGTVCSVSGEPLPGRHCHRGGYGKGSHRRRRRTVHTQSPQRTNVGSELRGNENPESENHLHRHEYHTSGKRAGDRRSGSDRLSEHKEPGIYGSSRFSEAGRHQA